MARMEGQVCLITGAARGQGAAEARLFAAEGATVWLSDVLDRQGHKLAVLSVRIEGLGSVLEQQDEAEGDRLAISIAQELRAGLRDFDVIGRVAADTFEILVPEPDAEVTALIDPLARRASGAITREPHLTLGETLRVLLGYAIYPEEAQTSEALLKQAREPRATID